MRGRIAVHVHADDPVSRSVVAQLRARPEVHMVDGEDADRAEVAIVVADEVDESALRAVRNLRRSGQARVVVVVTRLDDRALLSAVEAGACGLMRRSDAVPERLAAAIEAAEAGDGTVPPDLLGRLLDGVGRLQRQVLAPRGLTFAGLTEREVQVLRLVADGFDTNEIAHRLAYSERTIKNTIHDLTTRLNLRNRTHAVAYAVREGLI